MSLDIANLALDHLGSTPLATLNGNIRKNSDAFDKVSLILRNIDKAAKYVLKRCSWTELTLTVCPDELKLNDPACDLPEGFCYAFNLPSDFVNIYDVDNQGGNRLGYHESHCDKPHWSVRKVSTPNGICKALITDVSPIRIEYICLPKNLDTLDSDLIDLIGLQLAIRCAPTLKADKALRRELKQEFGTMLDDAAMVSGGQDAERLQIPNGPLTRARVGNHDVLYERRDNSVLSRRYGSYRDGE